MLRKLFGALAVMMLSGCMFSPRVEPVGLVPSDIDVAIAVLSPAQYNLFALSQFDGDVPASFQRRFRYYESSRKPEQKVGDAYKIYELIGGDDFFISRARETLRAQGYNVVTPDQADYFIVYSDLGFRKTPDYGNALGIGGLFLIPYSLGTLPLFCDNFAFTVQHSVYATQALGSALEAEQNVHVTRNCMNPWGHGMFPGKGATDELQTVYANLIEQSVRSMQVNYVLD